MDYAKLKAMIDADSGLTAFAQAGNDAGVADSLNAETIPIQVQYQLTTQKVLDVLGPTRGTAVMTALRGQSGFGEIVKLMDQPTAGVNLNHPDADAMFAALVSLSILTQAESTQILALRDAKVSPAVQSLGRSVSHLDVSTALRSL